VADAAAERLMPLLPAVILYNKWLLTWGGFPYPVALTLWHMAFCSTLAFVIIKLGFVQPIDMSAEMYLKWVQDPYSAPSKLTCWRLAPGLHAVFWPHFEYHCRTIVPIGGLYAGTLWLSNAAYLFLSVSFIQMLKVRFWNYTCATMLCTYRRWQWACPANQLVLLQALMPVAVFVVGCAFSTEKFSLGTFGNMIVVSIGVAIASYGALHFTPA
jgi:hypothetical protein